MTTCSLLIPVYNHAAYLEQCIESAINQVVPFDEIIIVDDCSTDPLVAVWLDKYKNHNSIKVHRNRANIGISATQNHLVSLAKSEFVAFLDCDDFLDREANAGFKAYHAIAPKDYFFSNRVEVGPDGEERNKVDVASQIFEYGTLTQCLLEHMVASHFKVIRKSSLEEVGGFPLDTDGVQDWVVAVRIIDDNNACHMAEYLYSHRIHDGQTTAQDPVRYMYVVNSERERLLEKRGMKGRRHTDAVASLSSFFGRIPVLPVGTFLLEKGRFLPWVEAWARFDRPTPGSLLVYSPKSHQRIAQNFYLCKDLGIESVMIVDHKMPESIAITRWANAFFDHIICLDSIARLAIEPWVADKSKIIQGTQGDIKRLPALPT